MDIHIDESGTFVSTDGQPNFCCVAALVIPSSQRTHCFEEFTSLKAGWAIKEPEVKGSRLGESEVAEVIGLLRAHDALLEVTAIELGLVNPQTIRNFKSLQAERLTARLTPEHHPNMARELAAMRDQLLSLPDQLFVQGWLTLSLVETVLQTSTLYFCQRSPRELGEFNWIVDAKDRDITSYENLWRALVMPALQFWSLSENPLILLEEGDYSHFERYSVTYDRAPDHLRSYFSDPDRPLKATDAKKLMTESFSFEQSDSQPGLQLVDILVNATRRAFHRRLRRPGWNEIGSLIASPYLKRKPGQPIRMVDFTQQRRMRVSKAVAQFYDHLSHTMKRIARKKKTLFLPGNLRSHRTTVADPPSELPPARPPGTKRPRSHQVLFSVDHPGGEILFRFGPGLDRFDVFGTSPSRIAHTEVTYPRAKGPKSLSKTPTSDVFLFEPNDALLTYDVVFAIDTNTRAFGCGKVSVAAVVLAERTISGGRDALRFTIPFCLEFLDIEGSPENLAWLALIDHIVSEQSLVDKRIAIIVDSDLDNLEAINARIRPIFGSRYLPPSITLVYASADSGKEFIANKLLAQADKQARILLDELEKREVIRPNAHLITGCPYRAFRKVSSALTDYGDLPQRYPFLFGPGRHPNTGESAGPREA